MTIQEFKVRAGYVKQLAAVGAKIINGCREFIIENIAEELMLEDETSPYQLRASFYGLNLLFRAELQLQEHGADGVIAAYRFSYESKPVEIPLNIRYEFDRQGNVIKAGAEPRMAHPYDECPRRLLQDVFSELANNNITIHPFRK